MKIAKKGLIILFSISMFIITLFISFSSIVNNPKFFQKMWENENVYEQINMSEEELTKILEHTMGYMWDKYDDIQISVKYNDNTVGEFYKDYGTGSNGIEYNEMKHMAECKVLFMGFKNVFVLSIIIAILSFIGLILNKKFINKKDLNLFYITYGIIILLILFLLIYALIDFDNLFTNFHLLFFKGSKVSWEYPSTSKMIIMLPEEGIFKNIVLYTITIFISISILLFIINAYLKKKVFKS